jgi:antitoxin VapB
LTNTGIKTVDFPWYDGKRIAEAVRGVIGKDRVAVDAEDFGLGLKKLGGDFGELRWSLTDGDIERYRIGARLASAAVESACQQLKPGMTEHEIAGILDLFVHSAGCNPVVTLIAADDRVTNFRHPIPTRLKAKKLVMLVCCAEYKGLISNLTRWVSFGKISKDLAQRQQAIANIDTAVNLVTRPGRTLGEVFKDLQQAYADNGHDGQWQYHHQGGSTGYAGREAFGNPTSTIPVLANQAFAWNPSIVGIKCEDTTLCTEDGTEVLTACSKSWPKTIGRFGDQKLVRPDILVR